MAIHKYMRGNEDGEWSSYYRKDMLTIGEDQGTPIYISKDGKIHAQGFVDVNDDFEFYVENDKFKVFAKDQREGFLAEYVFTKNDNKIYPSVSYDDLIQCFENIYFPLKVYDNQEPPETHKKYRLLNRKTKSQISSFTSSVDDPASFHFDFFEGTARHVEPRVEGAWFGPYNYDVYLLSLIHI